MNVATQAAVSLLPSFVESTSPLTVTEATSAPSNPYNTISTGVLKPSWSSLSSHSLVTSISIVWDVCLFVIVNPSAIEPAIVWSLVYSVGTVLSLTT